MSLCAKVTASERVNPLFADKTPNLSAKYCQSVKPTASKHLTSAMVSPLTNNFADFEPTGAVLLGISPQSVDKHDEWIKAKGFHFPLLADTDKKVIELYGVGAPLIGVRRNPGEGVLQARAPGLPS